MKHPTARKSADTGKSKPCLMIFLPLFTLLKGSFKFLCIVLFFSKLKHMIKDAFDIVAKELKYYPSLGDYE